MDRLSIPQRYDKSTVQQQIGEQLILPVTAMKYKTANPQPPHPVQIDTITRDFAFLWSSLESNLRKCLQNNKNRRAIE